MRRQTDEYRHGKRRLTILVALVLFVFVILLISVTASGVVLFLIYRLGLMQPFSAASLPTLLLFLLVISLFVGIILTVLAGNISLRPLKKFIDATHEIATGNFSVRVPARGPEEYRRLVDSFNAMAEELGSIETLRDDFVSSISHEYKTPIVSIRGFARLIKKGSLTPAQQDAYLDIIISEADRLAQLSGNVLLLSKLTSGGELDAPEAFRLDEQLRQVILLMNQQIQTKRLALDIVLPPCTIVSGKELLQQVWINLLGNAIKFTPEGGRVAVALACDEAGARVTVSDTGIGMDDETIRHIFDRFYQGDRSRSVEGNGLGLSLVQRIVTLHGGTVAVESAVGEGSAFTVTLPIQNCPSG